MTKQTPLNLTDIEKMILKTHSLHKTIPIEAKIAKDYLLDSNTKKKSRRKKPKRKKRKTRRHRRRADNT